MTSDLPILCDASKRILDRGYTYTARQVKETATRVSLVNRLSIGKRGCPTSFYNIHIAAVMFARINTSQPGPLPCNP